MENTFVMIKPDGVRRNLMGEIIKRIEMKGMMIEKMHMVLPKEEMVKEHYKEHEDKPFYSDLIEFISSGKVVLIQVRGDSAIKTVRGLIGDTDPVCAHPGTIRGDYANSKTQNLVHASDSADSAQRELKLWFKGE